MEQPDFIHRAAERINALSDSDEVHEQFRQFIQDFSNNPRDIKRFFNVLRFYRFLRETMQEYDPGSERQPSLNQLRRWIILSLNWPGFVRWLYSDKSIESMREKLDILVTLARENKDLKSWQEKVLMVSHIVEQKNISWLSDQNLKDFFNLESTKYKDEPLSESLENGLY
jgi:hypothetical protein